MTAASRAKKLINAAKSELKMYENNVMSVKKHLNSKSSGQKMSLAADTTYSLLSKNNRGSSQPGYETVTENYEGRKDGDIT